MTRLGFVGLLLTTVVSAVPLVTEPNLNASKWTAGYGLQPDDVILPIEGITYVIKESHYFALLKSQGISVGAPELDPSWVSYNASDIPDLEEIDVGERGLEPRQASCDSTFSLVTDKTETFVDWDVQMSPVVCAVGDMDISVSSGYSVSNTVGGSAGVDLTFVKDRLGSSLEINYSRTWTTQSFERALRTFSGIFDTPLSQSPLAPTRHLWAIMWPSMRTRKGNLNCICSIQFVYSRHSLGMKRQHYGRHQ
ncbi:hypothetical protein BGZ61DRAFT_369829 [Ilyonectria robusta]|uniref:uncharacterized protein n=1 Tax=Ilyonectria robusta TaxID=1079257 RepID=UPI001E8D0FE2|nr:uncharacterized protein BGZ61DRAFT_369829 [Ilyonectria robusta]KAH8661040.1 hypothetical protein BGZ61DRAFT_369829 [Ilyonectria robusta]